MSRDAADSRPPESAAEALARAGRHGRQAAAEMLAALHALLDAAALTTGAEPSLAHPLLGPVARLLAELQDRLERGDGGGDAPLMVAVAEALDAEIARWETRAREDADARAVLRAFLGLRELLWEFGVRPGPGPDGAPSTRQPRRHPPRVQRVRVQG